MSNDVSARGYVTVVLVLNMRRFVEPEYHKHFETLRGSPDLLYVLRHVWPHNITSQGRFRVAEYPNDTGDSGYRMSTEEVAFLSGIFRLNMIEDHAVPMYRLENKSLDLFPKEIQDNVQFTNVFLEVWQNWDIFVRPSAMGMFVINLRRNYDRSTPLLRIAEDVVSLQTAFDIPGANQRLQNLKSKSTHANGANQERQKSIEFFLEWLDVDQRDEGQPRYAPVQWKLAMEVCRALVEDAGLEIRHGTSLAKLRKPERTIATPLHDSFLIYHIDELIAVEPIVLKARSVAAVDTGLIVPNNQSIVRQPRGVPKIHVLPTDIAYSEELKQQLVGLLEGAVLRRQTGDGRTGRTSQGYFPEHTAMHMDQLLQANAATWSAELCILTSRSACIMPAWDAGDADLQLSNFSASTGKVKYLWYWEALERMFEFIIEVRVLAQIIERGSSDLLQEFEQQISSVRSGMSRSNIEVPYRSLQDKVEQVANMSRLLGRVQAMCTPSLWGRAEFSVAKARLLMQRQDIPQIVQHIERNVANLNGLINHIDELYLADLSEKNNRISLVLSVLFAGLSLSIVVFTITSFWADAEQLLKGSVASVIKSYIPDIVNVGNVLSLLLSLSVIGTLLFLVGYLIRNTLRNRRMRRMASRQ